MSLLPPSIDERWLRLFRRRLLRWYAKSHRPLPWRATDDPYAIWVSEIMLQQTQVVTVLDYFSRFLQRFPTIDQLAAADETKVLKYWEGLGYYRRARQMHAAAQQIMKHHRGNFPTTFDEVLSLPGIGRYTAGAICSFAYDQPTPIVEANTQRLYARLLKLQRPLSEKTSQAMLWAFAESFLTPKHSRKLNQAVMELGSLICQPTPDCPACPLRELCPTAAAQLQSAIPVRSPKITYLDRSEVTLIVSNPRGEFLVRQCGLKEWWSGLWDFPRMECKLSNESDQHPFEVQQQAHRRFGFDCRVDAQSFAIKHSVTKYRIVLACFRAHLIGDSKKMHRQTALTLAGQPCRWASRETLEHLPLSASARRVAKRLESDVI